MFTADKLQQVLGSLGFNSVDRTAHPFGVGLGVPQSSADFCVLSIASGDPQAVNLASTVLRDIRKDQPAILEITNRLTRDNPLFPCVLHDAEDGWDILILQRFSRGLLINVPEFLQMCVETIPRAAAAHVGTFVEFGGRRPEWGQPDFGDLVTRSML
jgi:hypothetical protein